MTPTLKHLGQTLIAAGAATGVYLIAAVQSGMPASPEFFLWIAAGATLSACGTIICVGHHIASRIDARASQAYWTQMAARLRTDTTADVHHLDTARTNRSSRTAN